jgi:hypothetical protein
LVLGAGERRLVKEGVRMETVLGAGERRLVKEGVRMETAFLPVRADFRSTAEVMPVGAAFLPSRPSGTHRDGRNAG